jgi:hypothetical protein
MTRSVLSQADAGASRTTHYLEKLDWRCLWGAKTSRSQFRIFWRFDRFDSCQNVQESLLPLLCMYECYISKPMRSEPTACRSLCSQQDSLLPGGDKRRARPIRRGVGLINKHPYNVSRSCSLQGWCNPVNPLCLRHAPWQKKSASQVGCKARKPRNIPTCVMKCSP